MAKTQEKSFGHLRQNERILQRALQSPSETSPILTLLLKIWGENCEQHALPPSKSAKRLTDCHPVDPANLAYPVQRSSFWTTVLSRPRTKTHAILEEFEFWNKKRHLP